VYFHVKVYIVITGHRILLEEYFYYGDETTILFIKIIKLSLTENIILFRFLQVI
jgi:hypothetical protein